MPQKLNTYICPIECSLDFGATQFKTMSGIEYNSKKIGEFGIEIKPISDIYYQYNEIHRDEYYIIILQQEGLFQWKLDFNQVELQNSCICFVSPGQVHNFTKIENGKGWVIFIDPNMIAKNYRVVFDMYLHIRQTLKISEKNSIFNLASILYETYQDTGKSFKKMLLKSMLDVVVGFFASELLQSQNELKPIISRKYLMVSNFRQLVKEHFRNIKKVKDYAEKLNISAVYLNEVIKEITGHPPIYAIQQEIMLEAKRLLYYTPLDAKEIAFSLGYEDYTYFFRLFKKLTGITPIAFRKSKP